MKNATQMSGQKKICFIDFALILKTAIPNLYLIVQVYHAKTCLLQLWIIAQVECESRLEWLAKTFWANPINLFKIIVFNFGIKYFKMSKQNNQNQLSVKYYYCVF